MISPTEYAERIEGARALMAEREIDVLAIAAGSDLEYLSGYAAVALDRLTLLVVGSAADAVLVMPELEAPRVQDQGGLFEVVTWSDGEDVLELAAAQIRRAARVESPDLAVSDRMWAGVLLGLQGRLPTARFEPASSVVGPLRLVKSAAEVDLLGSAAASIDTVAGSLADVEWEGRTEADVATELGQRIVAAGHEVVNFVIVASGANGASPHHTATERSISRGDVIVVDIGGRVGGYCSDTTRCVSVGEPDSEVAAAYDALRLAHRSALTAVRPGVRAEDVDAAARDVLRGAEYGGLFVHRTGHGIGLDEHEDPYIVEGNRETLGAGMCFSIEPGIYVPGKFGLRLEDIVSVTADGVEPLNRTSHDLVVLD